MLLVLLVVGDDPSPLPVPGVQLDSVGGFTYEYKYGRTNDGLEARDVRVVPLTTRFFDAATGRRVERQLPTVWGLLSDFSERSSKVDLRDRVRAARTAP